MFSVASRTLIGWFWHLLSLGLQISWFSSILNFIHQYLFPSVFLWLNTDRIMFLRPLAWFWYHITLFYSLHFILFTGFASCCAYQHSCRYLLIFLIIYSSANSIFSSSLIIFYTVSLSLFDVLIIPHSLNLLAIIHFLHTLSHLSIYFTALWVS